jgi:salicylate hydroxylase
MDDVLAVPELHEIYNRGPPGFVSWRDHNTDVFWVTYRCRDGKLLNNAVVHKTRAGEGGESLWHSPVSPAQVLATARNFHDTIKKLADMVDPDGITVHHLYTRPPLTSFVRGRTAVVGDAAHVMIPSHAAGGGIAIESAATLEVLFRDVDGRDSKAINERLGLFDKLRIPRCNLTMLASNAGPAWLDVPGLEDEIRRFYSGPLPPAGTQPYTKPFIELLFAHDEYRAAENMLVKAQASNAT